MKVAIIGAGHIARIHAPEITAQPENELVAVLDHDLSRARSLASELNVARCYQDMSTMMEEQKPGVVHVLTQPQQHAELSIEAMKHGCHVLVEKPMALHAEDAQRMIDAARQNKVRLCVNHNMVFEPTIQRAVKLATDGDLGRIVSVDVDLIFDPRRMPAYLEDGAEYSHWIYELNGGPLQDLMPHPVSILLEFIDDVIDIQTISHHLGSLPSGWDDEMKVTLRSEQVLGTINVSLNQKPDTMTLTISGKKGRVTADPFTGILTVQKKSCLPRAAVRALLGFRLGSQYFKGACANIFRFIAGRIDKSNGIGPLIARFYEALRTGSEIPASAEKGLKSVEVMDRIWPTRQEIAPMEPADLPGPRSPGAGPLAFVTGGTGFVGINLVKRLLASGHHVRALVRKNSLHSGRLRHLDVETVEGDLSERDKVVQAVRGVDVIYHLGAAMTNSWDEQENATINGTRHVVDAALEHGVSKLVHVSTLTVYELLDVKPGTVITEESTYQRNPKKMGAYAYSKIEAEKTVLEAVRNKNLDATIVRLGMVLGPLSRVFYPHLGYRLGSEVFIPIGKGTTVLPLVYVDNAVDGMFQAAQSGKTRGKIYNLVDDGEVTVNEFLEKYVQVTGCSARIVHLPYMIAYLITFVYEIVSGIGIIKKGATSRAQLKWKQSNVRYDTSKAKTDFGWSTEISLDEGMERTFRWYAERYGLD